MGRCEHVLAYHFFEILARSPIMAPFNVDDQVSHGAFDSTDLTRLAVDLVGPRSLEQILSSPFRDCVVHRPRDPGAWASPWLTDCLAPNNGGFFLQRGG